MSNSLLNEFRFKIGEQYELNEFNLRTLESTFSNGLEYENYEYIKGDFKTLFGLKLVSNVILQYNGDMLSGMIFKLNKRNLDNLIQNINAYLTLDEKLDKDKMNLVQTVTVNHPLKHCVTLDINRIVKLKVYKFLG